MIRRLIGGLRSLLFKHREDTELDDELRAYLEESVEQKMGAGLTRPEALRTARVEMGTAAAIKDGVRDAGWESRVEHLWHDARYALRGLRRSPGFTAVAVLTLALGIGANSALFSVVNSLLLRALPVAAPEQLVVLSTRAAIEQGFPAGWTYPIWEQIRARQDVFKDAIAWTVFPERFDLAQGGETDSVDGLFVSWDFFERLGVTPLVGRTFTASEDELGSPDSRVAVISHGFWQRRFGGAAGVVGRSLSINRVPVTIGGVTPPGFLGPEVGRAFDIAMPMGAAPVILNEDAWGTPEGRSYLAVMLRLRPDQSLEGAVDLLRGVQRQVIEAAMPEKGLWGPGQDSLLKDPFTLLRASTGTSELRRQYSKPLVTILAIAALVLLIACANIANLLLARATARRSELSVRRALGAPRWRLVQQMLIESLLLAGMGAVAGLLLALAGSRALVAQLSTWFDRVVLDVSLDWRVVSFTVAVGVVTSLLFGAAPALRASRVAPAAALRGSAPGRAPDRPGVLGLRGSLIGVQIALSVVLLVAAGLFIRTFGQLAALPLGFDSDRVLVVDVNVSRTALDADDRLAFYQRLRDVVAGLPGVAHAGASLNTPANRGPTLVADFSAPGGSDLSRNERRVTVNYVTPGWFETYGIARLAGRLIDARDGTAGPPVVVANEALVRKFFGARQPVGAHVVNDVLFPGDTPTPRTVIGVVGDAFDAQSLRYGTVPTLYWPLAQCECPAGIFPATIAISVRSASGSPVQLARSVAAALTAVDRNLAFSFRPLADQIDAVRHQERLVAWLSGFFGGLALLLSAIGLYGVTSYDVARRRHEIGIRVALGARRRAVVGLAVRQTMVMAAIGVLAGLGAAAAVSRYVESMIFGITPLDLVTFVAAPIILAAVAALSALAPARRAASVDLMAALRCE